MDKFEKGLFEIFTNRIEEDAIHDLNLMIEVVDYDNSQGRLAVPIALTIFSLLELFGFLISKDNDIKQTGKNLRIAFETFFPKEVKQHERDMLCS